MSATVNLSDKRLTPFQRALAAWLVKRGKLAVARRFVNKSIAHNLIRERVSRTVAAAWAERPIWRTERQAK